MKKSKKHRNQGAKYKLSGKVKFGYKLETINNSGNKEEEIWRVITDKVKALKVENPCLLLNKFVPVFINATLSGKNGVKYLSGIDSRVRKYFYEGITGDNLHVYAFLLHKRLEQNFKLFIKYGYSLILDKDIESKSRLVVGLGSSHVLETALTLHHIFGIPYIPGSALKGVCRGVAFWKLAEKKELLKDEDKLKNLQNIFYSELCKDDKEILKYQLLFGAQDFKGLLLFLDAYSVLNQNENVFALDIMNVHYRSYYEDSSGKTPPGDWEIPIPIYFLTVKPGVKFRIAVLFDKWRWDNIKDKEPYKNAELDDIKKELETLIKQALEEFGVGAKTRLGYGIFEICKGGME